MLNVELVGLIGLFYFALGHNKTKLKSHDNIKSFVKTENIVAKKNVRI